LYSACAYLYTVPVLLHSLEMEVRRMRPKAKISALDKKIKPNPRYNGVEPVVNTGSNLRTELEKLDEIHQFYKFRNDEIFRRITINNLVNLIVEVGKLEYQLEPGLSVPTTNPTIPTDNNMDAFEGHLDAPVPTGETHDDDGKEEEENIDTLIRSQFDPQLNEPTMRHTSMATTTARQNTARSVSSLVMGIGELDNTPNIDENGVNTSAADTTNHLAANRPFLVMDVRDPDAYARSHISLSVNYPAIRLNRAFDYETREMLRLKNKGDGIIVLYDDDESIASKCATTLTQRGYDNVFLLSGGLRVASIKYPDSLVTDRDLDRMEEGDIMVIEKLLDENITKGSSRLMGSRVGSRRSTCTGVSSRRSFSQDRPAAAVTAPSRDIPHRNIKNNRMAFNAAAPIRTSTALGAQPKKRFG